MMVAQVMVGFIISSLTNLSFTVMLLASNILTAIPTPPVGWGRWVEMTNTLISQTTWSSGTVFWLCAAVCTKVGTVNNHKKELFYVWNNYAMINTCVTACLIIVQSYVKDNFIVQAKWHNTVYTGWPCEQYRWRERHKQYNAMLECSFYQEMHYCIML